MPMSRSLKFPYHRNSRNGALCAFACALFLVLANGAQAELRAAYNPDARDEPRNATVLGGLPPTLEQLQEQQKSEAITSSKSQSGDKLDNIVAGEKDLALKIRRDSMRESALSFGARGGLSWRTKNIMDSLRQNATALDKSYDFRSLLIKAPSNMFVEPPIVSEAMNNFLVTPDGGEAAVADTIYQITRNARIVASPRNWRQYLERSWTVVLPPPDILLPESPEERVAWRRWVAEGWAEGIQQADEIFQSDLNRMIADFEGMVRYRVLLAQNKITAPYATMVDRGISGIETPMMIGNKPIKITSEMRIGDRAIRITEPVSLRADRQGEQWDPPIESAP
jgi:defect-in-organelle-trafficking protein DotC